MFPKSCKTCTKVLAVLTTWALLILQAQCSQEDHNRSTSVETGEDLFTPENNRSGTAPNYPMALDSSAKMFFHRENTKKPSVTESEIKWLIRKVSPLMAIFAQDR